MSRDTNPTSPPFMSPRSVVGLLVLAIMVPGFFLIRRVVRGPEPGSSQPAEQRQASGSPAGQQGVQQPADPPAASRPSASGPGTPKPASKPPEEAAPGALPPEKPQAGVPPTVAPATFKDVKLLVAQAGTLKERDAVLKLAGDHLSVLDRSENAEIRTLPYRSIVEAFYSRSKQPRWKGPNAKEQVAEVDFGRMGLFRGEGNWLILTTRSRPVFIRFEDEDLLTALPLIEERIGVKIQR